MADELNPDQNLSPEPDPSKEWPEEVKQAYAQLKIPSLYDSLLANEKMSLEIRKQNREIRGAIEGMQKIATVLDRLMEVISEEWEEVEEEEVEEGGEGRATFIEVPELEGIENYEQLSDREVQLLTDRQLLQDQSHSILIEMMDSTYELSSSAQEMKAKLFAILPEKEGLLRQKPKWYHPAEEVVQSYLSHLNHHKNRFQAYLEEMQIFTIDPKPGDRFDKKVQISLEEIPGGEPGSIAQVIRAGYLYKDILIRPAEVVIFA